MRGAVALPWSKTTSRTKGPRRNLGDIVWPAVAAAIPGCGRKARSRSCRRTGEGSDEPRSTGEAPEQGREERRRRAWREGGSVGGMADDGRCSGHRTGPSMLYPVASRRIGAAEQRPRSPDHARPPAGARCGKAARRDLCGGQGAIPVPTATVMRELSPCYGPVPRARPFLSNILLFKRIFLRNRSKDRRFSLFSACYQGLSGRIRAPNPSLGKADPPRA